MYLCPNCIQSLLICLKALSTLTRFSQVQYRQCSWGDYFFAKYICCVGKAIQNRYNFFTTACDTLYLYLELEGITLWVIRSKGVSLTAPQRNNGESSYCAKTMMQLHDIRARHMDRYSIQFNSAYLHSLNSQHIGLQVTLEQGCPYPCISTCLLQHI